MKFEKSTFQKNSKKISKTISKIFQNFVIFGFRNTKIFLAIKKYKSLDHVNFFDKKTKNDKEFHLFHEI